MADVVVAKYVERIEHEDADDNAVVPLPPNNRVSGQADPIDVSHQD